MRDGEEVSKFEFYEQDTRGESTYPFTIGAAARAYLSKVLARGAFLGVKSLQITRNFVRLAEFCATRSSAHYPAARYAAGNA